MTSSIETLLSKFLAIALCASGIVVILQICAVALAAVLGEGPHAAGPALNALMVATWAVVTAQLCSALVWRRSSDASHEA